jgi:F0F1-type ATP synthase assembly protein I
MEWVAKITTVGLEMVLPAIAGTYLDRYLRTSYWAVIGLVVGLIVGFWHLLQMTKAASANRRPPKGKDPDGE